MKTLIHLVKCIVALMGMVILTGAALVCGPITGIVLILCAGGLAVWCEE